MMTLTHLGAPGVLTHLYSLFCHTFFLALQISPRLSAPHVFLWQPNEIAAASAAAGGTHSPIWAVRRFECAAANCFFSLAGKWPERALLADTVIESVLCSADACTTAAASV